MSYYFDWSRAEDADTTDYYGFVFPDIIGPLSFEPAPAAVPEDAELVGIEVFSLSPVTSATGLKGILLDILGPYDNIVTQYKYQQNTSTTNYSYVNEITPDYPWIASAALFIVLIWSIFGLLRRGIWTK